MGSRLPHSDYPLFLNAGIANALRSDVHEEASVKTGARRLRDFPDIHSASSATAEHHERVCARSHSIPGRRIAPRRTSGCNLSLPPDLDVEPRCQGLKFRTYVLNVYSPQMPFAG